MLLLMLFMSIAAVAAVKETCAPPVCLFSKGIYCGYMSYLSATAVYTAFLHNRMVFITIK